VQASSPDGAHSGDSMLKLGCCSWQPAALTGRALGLVLIFLTAVLW
jgi:hypothetical protein